MTNGLSIGDYRYASLWDGCIGAWCPSATGPGGDILADRSPTQRHGILTSMDPETDWSVQEDGVALDFDGSNDRVLINGYADYADMTETTVAAWVYTRSSASQTFFCCSSSSVAAPILWMLDCSSTTLRFLVRNDGGSTAVAQLAASILTDQWMHLVGVRSSSGIELFRNGVSINSASTVITGAITPTDTLIGARNLGSATPTVFTNGLIDDVRAYNRALSPSDIQLLATRRGIAYERRIRRWVQVPASGSYELACDAGSYAISGTDCALTVARTLACDAGAYAISGTDAAIQRHYVFDPNAELPPHINIYTINGGEAFLLVGTIVSLDAGSYAISGTDCSLTADRTLACDIGAYAISGTDCALTVARTLACDAGAYAISGTDCALTVARTLACDAGAYAIAGTDVALETAGDFELACDAGSYTISGTDCVLTATRTLALDGGAYAISGTDVDLEAGGRTLIAEPGSYTISGADCGLTVARTLAADSGSYAISGTDCSLLASRTLSADAGSYTVAGTDVSLEAIENLELACDIGAYAVTGTSCTLQYSGAGGLRFRNGWVARKTRRVWIAQNRFNR